jgi:hypothetical protein
VLYDWRAGVALCQANAHMSDVHTCRFNPYSPGNEFVSVGNKHTKFWNGDTLEGANGLFGKVSACACRVSFCLNRLAVDSFSGGHHTAGAVRHVSAVGTDANRPARRQRVRALPLYRKAFFRMILIMSTATFGKAAPSFPSTTARTPTASLACCTALSA